MKTLFPKAQRPYYIYAPSYTHKSSGIRTLHLLCHALNEVGQIAYLVPDNGNLWTANPALNTPICSPQHLNYYAQNLDPIVVYPDIVQGNPFGAKKIIRYLLAPAGAYGGSKIFPESDQVWGALPSIADRVLRLPVSDPNIFYPEYYKYIQRSGSCFYSYKYDRICGNKLLSITDNSVRLEGTLEKLADTLRSSEVCYVYELTSAMTEAALCGCPVVLIRTPFFNTIDPACMMGNVKWDDGEIVKQCDDFLPEYEKIVADFRSQLDKFIEKTQGMS